MPDTQIDLQGLHVIKTYYIPQTNYHPRRVKIVSERFRTDITVSDNDERFDKVRTIQEKAVIHLRSLGFNIIGIGEGSNCMYIITDTFKSINNP